MNRKYKFNWELLGDLKLGRPNLGAYARVEMYRLMQFAFRDVLESNFGTENADKIFYATGKLSGEEFYNNYLKDTENLSDLIKKLQKVMVEMGIGILRVEEASLEKGEFILTVSEDLDCSGLPELDYEICKYDEGFIAGILEKFTGKPFTVNEVDCWCTGDRTCRFHAKMENCS